MKKLPRIVNFETFCRHKLSQSAYFEKIDKHPRVIALKDIFTKFLNIFLLKKRKIFFFNAFVFFSFLALVFIWSEICNLEICKLFFLVNMWIFLMFVYLEWKSLKLHLKKFIIFKVIKTSVFCLHLIDILWNQESHLPRK